MKISRNAAWAILAVLLLMLIVGTQMPGAWRDEAFRVSRMPWQLTKVAHFVIFAAMACVAHMPPLRMPMLRVALAALALALLTEGLQFLAANRSPSWMDVGIDLAGAGVGVVLALLSRYAQPAKL